MEPNTSKPAPLYFRKVSALSDSMSEDFLGGPKFIKLASVINFQKGATFIWVSLLMLWFQNTSIQAWVYLALHGTYGICWLLKDAVFPDPNWEKKVTIGSAIMAVVTVLGPYWLFPYILISQMSAGASVPFLCFAIALNALGIALMMVADAQKFFTLQHKRGLITTGMFKHIRHPNYLGEMMIYASFAIVVWHWIPWLILGWVWGFVFLTNMVMKEASMSRYPEWADYKKRSAMLLPKIF